jgi:hypothetical protein
MLGGMLRLCACAVVGIVIACAAPATAVAQAQTPTAERAQTQAAMEDYFAGEKRGGYVLIAMGIGGLLAGGLLYRSSSKVARGASYPLLGLGLVHAAAGVYIHLASNGRIDDFGAQIEKDPGAFVAAEQPRMKGVSTQFAVLKIVEVVLIAGGLGMAAAGSRSDRPRLKGAGLALALEAALTLGFDVVAARRAGGYRDELGTLAVAAHHEPDTGETRAVVGHAGRF